MGGIILNNLEADANYYDVASVSGFEEWLRFPLDYVDMTFERFDPDGADDASNRRKKIRMWDLLKESNLKFRAIKKKDDTGKSRVIAYEYELFLKPPQRFEHYYNNFTYVLNNHKLLHIQIASDWYSVDRTVDEDMLDGDETIHWDVTDYKIVPDDDYNYTEITIKGLAPASHITKDSQPFSNKRT